MIDRHSSLVRHEQFPSRHVTPRHVDVWLPSRQGTEPRLPVIYMHDGQNLFHPEQSFSGQHWGVVEVMEDCIAKQEVRAAIVVGIWHSAERGAEYLPKQRPGEGGGLLDNPTADNYLRFCVEELKPFIDRTYRSSPDRADTLLMGSSRGALASLHAVS